MLLLLDYWPLGRLQLGQDKPAPSAVGPVPLRALLLEKLPLIVLSVAFSVVAFRAQGDAVSSLEQFPLSIRLANVPLSYVRYMRKMFWPDDLAIFYPHPLSIRFLLVLAALCFLAMVTIWVVANGKRQPYLLVGWLWYLGSLVPVIGIVQLGAQAIADRYTYVPLIGLFIMTAWVGPQLQVRSSIRLTTIGASAILLACLASTSVQLGFWKDNISLFTRDLAVTASNSLAHYNLALALAAAGRTDESIEHFEATLKTSPGLPTAWNNLGIAFFVKGRLDSAAERFRMALKVKPDFADAHNNLANILFAQGNLDEAIEHYREALRIEPTHANAERNLRRALETKVQKEKK